VSFSGLPGVDCGFSYSFFIKASASSKFSQASCPLELPVSNPWSLFVVWLEASGFPLTMLWGGYFSDASRSYKIWPIYLAPELELDSRTPSRTLLLRIFCLEENLHVHIFSSCRGPCDYLRSFVDRAS
jgi:hypothetical protein